MIKTTIKLSESTKEQINDILPFFDMYFKKDNTADDFEKRLSKKFNTIYNSKKDDKDVLFKCLEQNLIYDEFYNLLDYVYNREFINNFNDGDYSFEYLIELWGDIIPAVGDEASVYKYFNSINYFLEEDIDVFDFMYIYLQNIQLDYTIVLNVIFDEYDSFRKMQKDISDFKNNFINDFIKINDADDVNINIIY